MIKYFISLLIIFFFMYSSSAQERNVVDTMVRILSSKNFSVLQNHIDNLPGARWECLRDITGDFKEGVLYFGYIVKDKDNPAMGTEYTFRVNLLTTKSTIIYYELSEKKYRKRGGDWTHYFKIIEGFKEDSSYNLLKGSFRSIYRANLNEQELFIADFVYGKRCGLGGNDPTGQLKIDQFVAKKDRFELLKWLKSTNTEKQIYSVQGFYRLKQLGIKLSEEELEMIKSVINKNGSVSTCSGCIYSRREISSITKEFKF